MIKLIFYSSLFLINLSAFGQIEFLGESESVGDVNSVYNEAYIFLSEDEKSIFFTRTQHPENFSKRTDPGDIWMSTLDLSWSAPSNLSVNSEAFTSPIGFTPDGRHFLFNKVWFEKGIYKGKVCAFSIKNVNNEISVEVPFLRNRSPLQTGSLSKDGRYLFLSLENSAGYGVDDLFVCTLKEDGTWSSPKNLGRSINTEFQEITPFLAPDNKTLFFASNGHGGSGGFDIFQSNRLDDSWRKWSPPINLGSSVNTSGSESSFTIVSSGEHAYFISTQNSDGYGDIRQIKIKSDFEEEEAVAGDGFAITTTDEGPEEEKMPGAKKIILEVINAKNNEPVFCNVLEKTGEEAGESIRSVIADSTNTYEFILEPNMEKNLEFKATGFLTELVFVSWSSFLSDTSYLVYLQPLESGNIITLKNVLFYRGTANFVEGSERELDLVLEMLIENPDIHIFLKGHTDNVGNPILNIQLSQERVRVVSEYLIENGIDPSRIDGKGYGGSEPVVSNSSEETRKLNRRVEFEVLRE